MHYDTNAQSREYPHKLSVSPCRCEHTYAAHVSRILFFVLSCAKFEPARAPARENHHSSTRSFQRVEKSQFACTNSNFAHDDKIAHSYPNVLFF